MSCSKPFTPLLSLRSWQPVLLPFQSLSFEVQASAAVVGAKGDRADIRPLGVDCSQSAWPYFEASCLRDVRHPLLEPRQAQFIADK